MNRKGFLRSIVMVAAAPDLVSQLEIKPPAIPNTTKMLNQLNFMIPDYLPALIKKYGSTSWMQQDLELLEKDKIENPKLYEFTNQSHRRPEEA